MKITIQKCPSSNAFSQWLWMHLQWVSLWSHETLESTRIGSDATSHFPQCFWHTCNNSQSSVQRYNSWNVDCTYVANWNRFWAKSDFFLYVKIPWSSYIQKFFSEFYCHSRLHTALDLLCGLHYPEFLATHLVPFLHISIIDSSAF